MRPLSQVPVLGGGGRWAVAIGCALGLAVVVAGGRVQSDSSAATSCGTNGSFFTGRTFNPSWNTRGVESSSRGPRCDDVFGHSGNKTNFKEVQTKNTSNNWVYQNWTSGVETFCYYKTEEITINSHFRSWTQPINHNC